MEFGQYVKSLLSKLSYNEKYGAYEIGEEYVSLTEYQLAIREIYFTPKKKNQPSPYWLLGNIASLAKQQYPDEFIPYRIAKEHPNLARRIAESRRVFEAYKKFYFPEIGFSVYFEVHTTKHLSAINKIRIIQATHELRLSFAKVRALCKHLRHNKDVGKLTIAKISSLIGNLEDKRQNEFILISSEGKAIRAKGKLTKEQILSYKFILMIKPAIQIIKGEIK